MISPLSPAHLLLPSKPSHAEPQVESLAKRYFVELASTVGASAAVSYFITTSPALHLFLLTKVVQIIATTIFYVMEKVFRSNGYERASVGISWLNTLNFALFTGNDFRALIHESGHALAIQSLYQNSWPIIKIFPLQGGVTSYNKKMLSSLGRFLGPAKTTFIISAAGPIFTLFISSIFLIKGIFSENRYLSKHLVTHSLMDFGNHFLYALSAKTAKPWDLAHDFNHLAIFGVDPLVAATIIIATPILILLGIQLKNKQRGAQKMPLLAK